MNKFLMLLLILSVDCFGQQKSATSIFEDNFDNSANWVVEQMAGGKTFVKDNELVIDDFGGCTVWCKIPFVGPLMIEYNVINVKNGGANDRVSDMNCFLMAKDMESTTGLLKNKKKRLGGFSEYDSLRLYYFGYGVHDNTKTRFRRYDGKGGRPLLDGHDLTASNFLLIPNHNYHIRIELSGQKLKYYCDDVLVYDICDLSPFSDGYFGFRTFKNHMRISGFKVSRLTDK